MVKQHYHESGTDFYFPIGSHFQLANWPYYSGYLKGIKVKEMDFACIESDSLLFIEMCRLYNPDDPTHDESFAGNWRKLCKELERKVKLPIAFLSADQWFSTDLHNWANRFHNVRLVFIYQCREIDRMKALSPFKSKMNTWLKEWTEGFGLSDIVTLEVLDLESAKEKYNHYFTPD